MPDATTYSAKKAKTTSTGPLLYSELDISNLTVDATLMGSNETRFATVKYNDARMVYQMASVGEAMLTAVQIAQGAESPFSGGGGNPPRQDCHLAGHVPSCAPRTPLRATRIHSMPL